MRKKQFLNDYCSGCGLCISKENMELIEKNGFLYPKEIPTNSLEFLYKVCPFSNVSEIGESSNIWGDFIELSIGYSSNPTIRNNASSGGIITTVACYLLNENIVDEVIQIGQNKEKPWQTQLFCSKNSQEIYMNMGSRYAQSSPLYNLMDLLSVDKKYAFIGKPCDIRALRNFQKINKLAKEKIIVTLSFFCAGVPSESANIKLLESLGMKKENCICLHYRGYGWPGSACAIDTNMNEYKMSYSESWGNILGRDIKRCCKLCMDGIGEVADIACADAWQLKNNYPDFTEHKGRNLIFSRTNYGKEIINKLIDSKLIVIEESNVDLSYVRAMQPSQYDRKATMIYKILAMRFMGKKVPSYKLKAIVKYSKGTRLSRKIDVFIGTISRVLKKRI